MEKNRTPRVSPGSKRSVASPSLSPVNKATSTALSTPSTPNSRPQSRKTTARKLTPSSTRASSPASSSRAHTPTADALLPGFVSRFGVSRGREPTFGMGSRFDSDGKDKWDMMYDVPDSLNTTFGPKFSKSKLNSIEIPLPTLNASIYNTESGYALSSDYIRHGTSKFLCAPRKGPALVTPSPGSVYETAGVYTRGSDTAIKISFNCDQRPPIHNTTLTSNVDCVPLDLPQGVSKTFGRKLREKKAVVSTPGAIYDVHKRVTFKTGPSFSFGAGNRF